MRIEMIVLNACPHPGFLPQARENLAPSHELPRDWICQTLFCKAPDIRWLFPLPGGEGERSD